MDNEITVLALSGTLRPHFVWKHANLGWPVNELLSCKGITNSEAMLYEAIRGVLDEGVRVTFDPVQQYHGVVVATPVYFGDYSSKIHGFFNCRDNMLGKAFGCVSVGAKRNGGQETSILFAIEKALEMGAVVTGNGPPTGQYGGTGVGGNLGGIIDDDWGLNTAYGTGRRVAELAKALSYAESEPIKRCYLDITSFEKKLILPCQACAVCPNGDLKHDFTCTITQDHMPDFHRQLTAADLIIFDKTLEGLPIFHRFIERTRFIRRNHFELSHKLGVTSSPQRIAWFLRQNMFVTRKNVTEIAGKLKTYRITLPPTAKYNAVGYPDATDGEKCYRD